MIQLTPSIDVKTEMKSKGLKNDRSPGTTITKNSIRLSATYTIIMNDDLNIDFPIIKFAML
jgi:hypothetical protein